MLPGQEPAFDDVQNGGQLADRVKHVVRASLPPGGLGRQRGGARSSESPSVATAVWAETEFVTTQNGGDRPHPGGAALEHVHDRVADLDHPVKRVPPQPDRVQIAHVRGRSAFRHLIWCDHDVGRVAPSLPQSGASLSISSRG